MSYEGAWRPSSDRPGLRGWRSSSGSTRSLRQVTGCPIGWRPRGGQSVFGTAGERSRQSTWTALAAVEPDIVIVALCGFDLPRTLAEWAAFKPPVGLQATPAWRRGQVWAIDGSAYASRPGPRLIEGVEILSSVVRDRGDQRAVRLSNPG